MEGDSEFLFTYFYLSGRLDTLCHVRQSEDCSQQKIFHLKRTRKKGPRMVCLKTLTFVDQLWRFKFFFSVSEQYFSSNLRHMSGLSTDERVYPNTTHTALFNVTRHWQITHSTIATIFWFTGSTKPPILLHTQ